jgi:hypothetical protein
MTPAGTVLAHHSRASCANLVQARQRLYLINAASMLWHRPRTETERQTNSLIRQPVREPTQHRLFAFRQLLTHRCCLPQTLAHSTSTPRSPPSPSISVGVPSPGKSTAQTHHNRIVRKPRRRRETNTNDKLSTLGQGSMTNSSSGLQE